jgi:hypothetical protein
MMLLRSSKTGAADRGRIDSELAAGPVFYSYSDAPPHSLSRRLFAARVEKEDLQFHLQRIELTAGGVDSVCRRWLWNSSRVPYGKSLTDSTQTAACTQRAMTIAPRHSSAG